MNEFEHNGIMDPKKPQIDYQAQYSCLSSI